VPAKHTLCGLLFLVGPRSVWRFAIFPRFIERSSRSSGNLSDDMRPQREARAISAAFPNQRARLDRCSKRASPIPLRFQPSLGSSTGNTQVDQAPATLRANCASHPFKRMLTRCASAFVTHRAGLHSSCSGTNAWTGLIKRVGPAGVKVIINTGQGARRHKQLRPSFTTRARPAGKPLASFRCGAQSYARPSTQAFGSGNKVCPGILVRPRPRFDQFSISEGFYIAHNRQITLHQFPSGQGIEEGTTGKPADKRSPRPAPVPH